ncbi:MAG: DUF2868 domain-containing protein [Phycisphaeraceae bacterium]|nr:DUF2868 domain-containing protein [Phycisphaeraceae bacterium]
MALALVEGATPRRVDGLRGHDLDERAIERLRVLPEGRAVEAVLQQLGAWPRSMLRLAIAIAVVLVALGSAALVTSTGAVSVPAVLMGTLGLQTVLLILWLLSLCPGTGPLLRRIFAWALIGPARTIRRFGAEVGERWSTPEAISEWIGRWRRGSERDHAAVYASMEALSMAYAPRRGLLAALVYGVWSNAAWLAANALMLVVLAMQLLRSRTYTLHSGLISPELSRSWIEPLVTTLSTLMPASMLPDAEALSRAALDPGGIAPDSWRWGTLILATVVLLGVVPRTLALFLALVLLPVARRRWRIPWDDARLAATQGVIEASLPPVTILARERPADDSVHNAAPGFARSPGAMVNATSAAFVAEPTRGASAEVRGRPGACLAFLRLGDASAVQCFLRSVRTDAAHEGALASAIDLGCLTDGGLDAAERAAAQLAHEQPALLLLLCALSMAPRRGVADLLDPLRRVASVEVAAVLSGAAPLRRGGAPEDLERTIHSWRSVLERSGVRRIIELDGALPSPRIDELCAGLRSGHVIATARVGRLESALGAIADAIASWGDRTLTGDDARRLLNRIGAIYGAPNITDEAPFIMSRHDPLTAGEVVAARAIDLAERSTGFATLEARRRGEALRAAAIDDALALAVELELQGCGEVLISRAVQAVRTAWSAHGDNQAHTQVALRAVASIMDDSGVASHG